MQRAATAGTPLPRELGLYIAADVCRALAYAHSKTDGTRPLGIVHRDISPHNVLLSEQGEIKLTDFGIAKAMNKREQTGTGVVKGKVAFMSPEQAMGKPIDQRSDLFSLGTVLYLLMVRARPFEGPTDLETLLRVQKGDFTPPEAVAPDLEPEVAAIINRALKHDVNERYQSADEMLADIEHVLRSVFRPVGQTELKRWLAELSTHDGLPSILKGGGRQTVSRTGTGELDGKDVVLSDSQELIEDEISTARRGRRWRSSRRRAGGRMRMSRQRPANMAGLALPVPRDAETDSGRAPQRGADGAADLRHRGAARAGARAAAAASSRCCSSARCWSAAPGPAAITTGQWFGEGEPATETGASPSETETERKTAAEPPRTVPSQAEPTAGSRRPEASRCRRPPGRAGARRRPQGSGAARGQARRKDEAKSEKPRDRARASASRRTREGQSIASAPPTIRSQEHDGARTRRSCRSRAEPPPRATVRAGAAAAPEEP